jgi:hypothetical protein
MGKKSSVFSGLMACGRWLVAALNVQPCTQVT